MFILAVVVCALLFVIGAPIYMALALGGLIILVFHAGFPLHQLAAMYFDSINSFTLLAAPLFIMAGTLMLRSGMSKPLVDFLGSFTARLPGGLAVSSIVACTFIGALTGSTMATLVTVGLIMLPAMETANYGKSYSAALLCSSASLGNLIPPSLLFILYGFLTETSVAQLFMAGIMPGFVLAALLSITAILIAKRRKFPLTPSVSWKERGRLFIKALPGIFMPVIILGGIYGGIFTPTEAAAVACVYCLLVGTLVYRGLNWKTLWASLTETVQLLGMILLLACGGMLFGKAFALVGFPQAITGWVVTAGVSQLGFLLLFVLVFIGLGCIMEPISIMFVIIPLIIPAAMALDINFIHLGVIFCISLLIGGMTPPVSIFLFATAGVFKVPVEELTKEVLPFIGVTIVTLLIITLIPEISLWLPGAMLGG